MKSLLRILLLFSFMILLLQCGGSKKMTQEELNQMPTEERVLNLEKYVEKNPDDLEAKKQLYHEYLAMGTEARAIPLMNDILKADPYQSDVQYEYGELMLKRGETQVAYQAFLNTLKAPGGSYYLDKIASKIGSKYMIQQVNQYAI